ncbi:catalase [Enteractinococcus coprophilus]|uniref:Catalase n=1 Tax=Enteractinococcus coprophilus TaxID=1027633 RepID=A0A543AIY9_9MICC|nr:catalase [Enteractinococcus coprophilus]TQL72547.1 catalase [Enteractinococcus coprophilus]
MAQKPPSSNAKIDQLNELKKQNTGEALRQDSGVPAVDNEQSLRAGRRGPALLHDPDFYRKQSHFSRERIPEKVVHARGFGVHGEFELTKSLRHVTKAHFLSEPGIKTPTFVRLSTFIGSKGSKDTAIDVRGFATKFYTQEGNYDNLALSFGVFIIKDAMKFVDFTHAIKPNPKTAVPQAASAHDTLWDWVVNNQESAHMVMWLQSMRARPRSWRMMEAWPINTFRFINAEGKSTFARFVWKPHLGVHGLLLEEADILGGVDPDFHRNDMIEAIQAGAYPKYDLGVQLIAEEDEFAYDFDILDDTKFWPEEVVPVEIVGTMTLNRLVDNAFAEEEQSSFDPASLVPGIEFSHDPVLQGRSFAYRDTDYHRLGTANINNIPINQPIIPVHNNQRDGHVRHDIDTDMVTYHKNSLAENTPSDAAESARVSDYPAEVEGHVTRQLPSEKFDDHFSQARMFWNSMTTVEQQDIIKSFSYHLGKVVSASVRQQTVDMFANVDETLAIELARNIGVNPPEGTHVAYDEASPALSMTTTPHSAATQKVGVLIGQGFQDDEVRQTLDALQAAGAFVHIVSDKLGMVAGANGLELPVDTSFVTAHPAQFDAYYVVGGSSEDQKLFDEHMTEFARMAYKFFKPIGVASTGETYLNLPTEGQHDGVVLAQHESSFGDAFVDAIAQHRFWDRV